MINFNEPPYMEKSMDYIRKAVENKKICGDGEYTKKCNAWLEEHTGTKKADTDAGKESIKDGFEKGLRVY